MLRQRLIPLFLKGVPLLSTKVFDRDSHSRWKHYENLSKSKLIPASISLVTDLPRETVRRKLLELNKKKILVLDKKRGIQLGEKFEIFHKKFTQHTTLKVSEILKKWEKIGALEFMLNVNKRLIPATVKALDERLKFEK